MKVLIIGDGLLGHYLYDEFKKHQRSVEMSSRNDFSLTDRVAMDYYFRDVMPTHIINTAALTDVNGCENSMVSYDSNAIGPLNIAFYAKRIGVKNLVQISTDYIWRYDSKVAEIYDRKGMEPESTYGVSKLLGEEAVKQIMPVGCSLIARVTSLYGNTPNNFFTRARARLAYEGEIKMVNDQFFKPSYSKLVAQKIYKAVMQDRTGEVHIAAREMITRYEFFKQAYPSKAIYSKATDKEENPRRPMKLDLRPSLGYELPTWREQLEEFFNDNPEYRNLSHS